MHSAIIFSKSDPSSLFICSLKSVSAKQNGDNKKSIVITITKLLTTFFKLLPPIF